MKHEQISGMEKGRNITLKIHLMRHGIKSADGSLSEQGAIEAREFGASMSGVENMKAYTGSYDRVIDTAKEVQAGVENKKQFNQKIRKELSASLLKAPGAASSKFFKNVVLKRLEEAHKAPEEVREQKILEAEQMNMEDWLSYENEMIDDTTNSPKNVARAVAHHLIKQIDMAEKLDNGSDVDLLNVTHEFMLAAIIKYAVEMKDDDGKIISGDEIMHSKQSIKYLESIDINVTIDEAGNKSLNLIVDGKPAELKFDALKLLAEEYKQ